MARIRTIKPTLWESQKLGRCSILARLNFIGLITLADDQGRGRGDSRFLFGHLHAYDESITEPDFRKALDELEAANLVAFYEVDGCRYYSLPGWDEHQVISHPTPSDKPPVPVEHPMARLWNHSGTLPEPLRTDSRGKGREGKGKEGKGGEGAKAAASAVEAQNGTRTTTTTPTAPKEPPAFRAFMDRYLTENLDLKPGDPTQRDKVGAAYRRYGKAGRDVLAMSDGDPTKAITAVNAIGSHLSGRGLSWTLDTIAKHTLDYFQNPEAYTNGPRK